MRELTARGYANKHCVCPCQGCDKRKPGCHGECEAYQSYRAEYKRMSGEMYQTQKMQNLANDFAFEGLLKNKLRHGGKVVDL